MLPSEMVILMASVVNYKTSKNLLTRPMDVTSEYIGYLYNSLVKRGYLRHHRSAGYQLTAMGREAVFDFIRKNRTGSKDVVKRLKLLGIDISPQQELKIDKLEKDAIKVK
jgi:predicted transcriptional regulator